MTDADIVRIIQLVDKRKSKGGDKKSVGRSQPTDKRSAEETAKVVDVGATKVKETRTVLDHADEQTKNDVMTGQKTIHQAYEETKEKKKVVVNNYVIMVWFGLIGRTFNILLFICLERLVHFGQRSYVLTLPLMQISPPSEG